LLALWPAAAACAAGLILTGADFHLANLYRAAAKEFGLKYTSAGRVVRFDGHWGWQYYLEQLGATPLEIKSRKMVPGDVIVTPTSSKAFALSESKELRLIETKDYPANTLCATMNRSAGAGFYAAGLGPLPFVFGKIQPECFTVYEVKPVDLTSKE